MRVGLTGGIGAGKSAVAARLVEHGAVLIDSDVLAREVLAPGTPGLARVLERFGAGVLDAEGALDRPALGQIVFADPQARADLNAIVHPLVRQRSAELAAAAPAGAVVVHDVPLLVETGQTANYDVVVVVVADPELRVARLRETRGMDEQQARARITAQATDAERRAVADVLLDNSGTHEELTAAVDRLYADLVARPTAPAD
ncbi:MAG: dephospho-CoA kinase [Geodermatophilaceae bacterium]|nr:dephospho-CoA kinase [Geodermatophilaceae bacterium]